MPATQKWRHFTLSLPDFPSMSDTDLALFLGTEDGLWHPQTKAAMKQFATTNIELNSNWAIEYHAWRCPTCRREKRDIFRRTESGILKACLEIHHDHLRDYVKDELIRLFGTKWSREVNEANRHVEWITSALGIRFSDILICSDCNEIDGRIKSRLKSIDRQFSFSPSQIAACITPRPNQSHQIDVEAAEKIWLDAKIDFDDRKALLRMILEKLKSGGLRREEAGVVSPQLRRPTTSAQLFSRFASPEVTEFLDVSAAEILKRSVSKGLAQKAKRHLVVAPTRADLVQLVYGNGASKKWDDAPISWTCPICERTKLEVARLSKSKKWFAGIYEHVEWHGVLLGTEPDIERHEWIDICADCFEVFPELSRKKPALSDSFLTAEQIKRIIIEHGPHRPHDIDWEMAVRLATENQKWEKPKQSYWPRYHHAKRIEKEFHKLQQRNRTEDSTILDALADLLAVEFPFWERHDLLEHLHYALEDARRWPDRR